MQPREALDAAVVAGVITADQAERLVLYLAPLAAEPRAAEAPVLVVGAEPADPDEEEVHFARGFQDVFLTIGLGILLVGLGIGLPMVLGPIGGLFACAAITWMLAEFFARKRMLVLPSIALAIGLTLFVGVGVGAVLTGAGWELLFGDRLDRAPRVGLSGAVAALLGALVFFARFRLPFALLLVATSATAGAMFGLEAAYPGFIGAWWTWALLGAGVLSFIAAMAFDVSDPLRRTLRSDNAFWLHLFAAPLIVHSTISLIVDRSRTDLDIEQAGIVIAVVLAIALVAVIIDRRALLVSGLSYLGFAIGALMQQSQLSVTGMAAATMISLGAFVVMLGAGWKPVRRLLLGWLPRGGLARYLPPVRREAFS